MSIILGIFPGGYLSSVYSAFLPGGAIIGGFLGGLLYAVIGWAVSRRSSELLPYDRLDGHRQSDGGGHTQTPGGRVRGMQDGLMDDFMRFKQPPPGSP